MQAAEATYRQLVPFVEEMQVIKTLITSVPEEMALEESKPPLPEMEIFRVTIGGNKGQPFQPPAQNGDDLHFSAKVAFPPGEPVDGAMR